MRQSTKPGGDRDASDASAARTGDGARLRDGASQSTLAIDPFKERVGPAGDAIEREADRMADAVVRGRPLSAHASSWSGAASESVLWRKCAECEEEEEEEIRRAPREGEAPQREQSTAVPPAPAEAEAGAEKEPARSEPAPSLLVEDDGEAGRGQMQKSQFLAELRAEACAAVDGALAGTGRDSSGCPFIEHWFSYYEGRSAAQVERSLRRYAPEAIGAPAATDYIRIVTARIRRSAETFAKTGEVTGVPDDMPGPLAGGGALALFGGMFFKARPGGARPSNPESVRARLGGGQSLPTDVRTRMESAFGASFSAVRLHDDPTAANLSDRLNARAFTIGSHVAFGRGEFRPGTLAGDALIAHELAHVVQQGGGAKTTSARAQEKPAEADANRSAATVVHALWSSGQESAGAIRRNAAPVVRSGLTLSRCGKSEREKEVERLGGVQLAFLEQRRKEEEERQRKQAEEDAKKKGLPPPAAPPKVELSDITKKDATQFGLPALPTAEWDAVVDKPAWEKKAQATIAKVIASLKGTEIEPLLKGVTIKFTPKEALEGGFYASFNNNTLSVSMSWIRFAEKDPKNVWDNIVHEAGGHRKYGGTFSTEIMDAALAKLPKAERKKVRGDEQKFFEAYGYPETEIYAALWQRRYQKPESGPKPEGGGSDTDTNITNKLKVMGDVLAPEVRLAVLKELKRRVDANDQILPRDKKFFVDKVKEILKIDL